MLEEIRRDPERLILILKEDPALMDYLLKKVELKQKYLKLPEDVEEKLKDKARESGLSEAALILLGLFLLFALLEGRKR